MLDVNAPVLTRDGREARILATDAIVETGGYGYPICAEVEHPNEPGKWVKHWYTRDGSWHHAKTCQANDLVNYPWTPPAQATSDIRYVRTAETDVVCLMHYAIGLMELGLRANNTGMGLMVPDDMIVPRGRDTYRIDRIYPYYVLKVPVVEQGTQKQSMIPVNVTDLEDVIIRLVTTGLLDDVWLKLRLLCEETPVWETEWSRRYADIMDKSIKPNGINKRYG